MHVQCCSVFVQCMSVRYRAFWGMSVVFKTSSEGDNKRPLTPMYSQNVKNWQSSGELNWP